MQLPIYAVLPLLPLALATRLRVTIPPSPQLPNPAVLPSSTHATLTTLSNQYTAALRFDNTFDFKNVSSGSYLLDVHCHSHGFAPLRVDVVEKAVEKAVKVTEGTEDVKEVQVWGTFRGNEWNNKGEIVEVKGIGGVSWFEVRALGGKEYLVDRPGCECTLPLSVAGLWLDGRQVGESLHRVKDARGWTRVTMLTLLKQSRLFHSSRTPCFFSQDSVWYWSLVCHI